MKRIVIDMSGGLIQAVFSDDPETEVVIVDWDDLDAVGYETEEYNPSDDMHKLVHAETPFTLNDVPSDTQTVIDRWARYETAPRDQR